MSQCQYKYRDEIVQRFALMAMNICVTLMTIEFTQKKRHRTIRRYTHTINESSWVLAEDGFICNHTPI